MTQSEYRLVLEAIRSIELGTLLSLANGREALKQALYDTKAYTKGVRGNLDILDECRRDRAKLSRWFHGSRIGNPPVLETVYSSEAESRGEH